MSLCALCAQLGIENFSFRDGLKEQPYGADEEFEDDFQAISDGESEGEETDEQGNEEANR